MRTPGSVQKWLAILAVVACMVPALAGCGSNSSPDSSTSPPNGLATGSSPPGFAATGAASANDVTKGFPVSPEAVKRIAKELNARAKADARRIKNYGTEAGGADKAAVVAAMRNFMAAFAAEDYARVCAGLESRARDATMRQLTVFERPSDRDCAEVLGSSSLSRQSSEAREVANGRVTSVRIGKADAYVLYRPASGDSLSYITMIREGSAWKAADLDVGHKVEPQIRFPRP